MVDVFKKISFLSLILSLIISLFSCINNDSAVDCSITYFNDFEFDDDNTIWKNIRRVNNDSAFSGEFVCECPADMMYAYGFNFNVDDSIGDDNMLLSIDMKIKAAYKLNSIFVISIKNEEKTSFWNSFPMSDGFVAENQWYENAFSISLPNDIIRDSELNCYILNDKGESFIIDDFRLNIKYFNIPAYVDEVERYDIPKDLKNIFNTKSVNILYSEKRNQIVLADENDKPLTKPLSLFYSLIVDNDTVGCQTSEFQTSEFQNLKISEAQKLKVQSSKLKAQGSMFKAQLTLFSEENNPNVNFNLETTYDKDVRVLRSSLIIPFLNDEFVIYRRNPFVDSCDYQDVYYLDKEGFSLSYGERQLNLYHPDKVSSIQLDIENATAYINTDYYLDHPLVRFELLDTVDCYIDNSPTIMKKGESLNSSFVISLTDKTDLPRIMPVFDGYESAFIWTEHADWSDIKTHRATYFGREDIVNIEDATGGFAYYDIPVTKSVFYHNPDSVVNIEKNPDFPGLHSTIMTDSSFFDFLKQLRDKGFDICLHTPEQYTSTNAYLAEALSFMQDNFASPTWIDHGYNNDALNNREDMVCDGLDSCSPYYVYDLWKENGVSFPWNASMEDMRPFDDYLYDYNLQRPYPGFGDAFPLPRVMWLKDYPDILLWSTPCTTEPGDNLLWDYYFSSDRLDKIVDFRDVVITHMYAPWVEDFRGFWEVKDGKYVSKEGFDKALKRIADMRDKHILLPTTIAKYMTYQKQLRALEYRVNEDGSVMLKNNNKETIKGLSLISVREMSLDDKKSFNKRKTHSGNEWIIWFDIKPDEVVRVNNVNQN